MTSSSAARDNAYYHKYFTPAGGWSRLWERLGGAFLSAPGVTCRQGSGEIDVVGVGRHYQLYHASGPRAAAGRRWARSAAASAGARAASRPPRGSLDIYVRGTPTTRSTRSPGRPVSGWSDFVYARRQADLGVSLPRRGTATGATSSPAAPRQHRLRRLLPGAELGGFGALGRPGQLRRRARIDRARSPGAGRAQRPGDRVPELRQHLDRVAEPRPRAALHAPPRPAAHGFRAAPASRPRLHPGRQARARQHQRAQARGPQEAADHQGRSSSSTAASTSARTARSRTRRASA